MAGPAKSASRPLSPHLQIWRWHPTMATSILHRATGVGLYVAAIGLAGWLMALASGPEAYTAALKLLGSWPGLIVLYLASVGVAYHIANGLRHLIWDSGTGFSPKVADRSAALVLAFAVVAPIGIWALTQGGAP